MDLLEALLKLNEARTVQQVYDDFGEKLTAGELDRIIKLDPTSKFEQGKTGNYTEWMIRKAIQGQTIDDNLSKVLGVFANVSKKQTFPKDKKDIMRFKTVDEFKDFMNKFGGEEKTGVELTYGIKPIFKGKYYTLYQPKTWEESKKLRGDDAVWCTGDHRDSGFWDYYSSRGDIIIFYDNRTNKPAWQLFIKNGKAEEFADPDNDHEDFIRWVDVSDGKFDDVVEFLNRDKRLRMPIIVIPVTNYRDGALNLEFYEEPNNKPGTIVGLPTKCNNFHLIRQYRGEEIEYEINTLQFYLTRDNVWKMVENLPDSVADISNIDKLHDTVVCGGKEFYLLNMFFVEAPESGFLYIEPDRINGITLLSIEEAEQLQKHVLLASGPWWLRSPGQASASAASVDGKGVVNDYGYSVYNDHGGVRPALQIPNLNSLNLKIGDIVECLHNRWYYVGNDKILAINVAGQSCFNKDWEETERKREAGEDIFEGSDIQKYLEDWLKKEIAVYEWLEDWLKEQNSKNKE